MNTGSNTTVRFEHRDDPIRERPEPCVGDTIASGRYTLLEVIGEGGIGTVFRAEDNTTGREVALKTLISRYVGRPEREQRLLDEFSYLDRIEERAHVVAPIEMGRIAEFEGWPFLVMELVPGRSLFSRFILGRPPSTEEALDIAIQVARAIQAVHRVQVAHRDVTPQNILIHEEDGQLSVNLIDFSHATDTSGPQLVVGDERRLTRAFEVPGTAQYMPPEQAGVASGHSKMDIYSFGVVLYEMVTGRNPFAGLTREDYIELQREDSIRVDPIDPRVFPEIPEALIGLIERCTRRRPEGRPDIGQVVRRLTAIRSAVVPPMSASVEVLPDQAEPGHAVASGGVHDSLAGAPPRLRVVSSEPSPPADVRGGVGELDASADQAGSEDPDDVIAKRSQRSGIALVVFLVVVTLLLALAWWWGARERTPVLPPSRPKASQGPRAPTPPVDEVEPPRTDAKHPPATQEHREPPPSEPPAPPTAAASPSSPRDDRESDPPAKRSRRPRPRKSVSPALSAQPPSPSPSDCRRRVVASRAARAQRRWKHVLRNTKDRTCWSNATDERLALRVEALMELTRWAECAQLGSQSPNPRVKRWAAVCQTRADILEDAP